MRRRETLDLEEESFTSVEIADFQIGEGSLMDVAFQIRLELLQIAEGSRRCRYRVNFLRQQARVIGQAVFIFFLKSFT